MSTIEELLERKRNGSGLENREYGLRDPSGWPHGTLYPKKLALTSPIGGGRSVGIVRSQTQATKFSLVMWNMLLNENGLRLSIYAYYSWEMILNVDLGVSFDNI
jgi:hypothetical protein